MGKARSERRAILRAQGKLPQQPKRGGTDIAALVPVMRELNMTAQERYTFQHAIVGVLLGAFTPPGSDLYESPDVAYDRVDALPDAHRDAAYTYILRKLEDALVKPATVEV